MRPTRVQKRHLRPDPLVGLMWFIHKANLDVTFEELKHNCSNEFHTLTDELHASEMQKREQLNAAGQELFEVILADHAYAIFGREYFKKLTNRGDACWDKLKRLHKAAKTD